MVLLETGCAEAITLGAPSMFVEDARRGRPSGEDTPEKVGARRWIATDAGRASARNKPSSVPVADCARGRIIHLGPPSPATSCGLPGTRTGRATPRPLFGLAPDGVYRATSVTSGPVRSYRTLSPLPVPQAAIGGLLSVALSIASRRPGVTRHPALRSSDFPPDGRGRRRSSLARSPHDTRAGRDVSTARSGRHPRRATPLSGGRPPSCRRDEAGRAAGTARPPRAAP